MSRKKREPSCELQSDNARLRARVAELEASLEDERTERERRLQENAAHETLERQISNQARDLERVLHIARDAFVMFDAAGRLLRVNPAASALLGYTEEELLGLCLADVETVENREEIERHLDKIRREGADFFLTRLSRKDGTPVDVEVSVHLLESEEGTFFSFWHDVTDRLKFEKELHEREERWLRALESNGMGVWDWRVDSGEVYYSQRLKTMLGYTEEDQFPNRIVTWEKLVHPDDRAAIERDLLDHLSGRADHYQNEHRLRCKDGSYRWILDYGQVIEWSAEGRPLRAIGTHTDITDRKQIESALTDRTQKLEAFFALSPDGILSLDREDCIRLANPAFGRLTGIDRETLVGQSVSRLDALLAERTEDPNPFPGILAYFSPKPPATDKRGTRKLLKLRGNAQRIIEIFGMCGQTESVGKLLYFCDVTHEVEVDRMKSEFLSSAAHELRTPMSSVLGFAELLLHQDFDEETRRDLLETIHRQTELLVQIINELLDLARIESRRGKDFVYAPLDVVRLIRETVADLGIDRGVWPFALDLPAGGLKIRGDASKLRQALTNVLGNAWKYSPAGGPIEIGLSCRPGSQADELGIRVRDCGIGMTPEQTARVFERFYRANAGGPIPGTGLGMSIVKEIVDLHGGDVEVSSEYGQGTEVTLWLPVASEPEDGGRQESAGQ